MVCDGNLAIEHQDGAATPTEPASSTLMLSVNAQELGGTTFGMDKSGRIRNEDVDQNTSRSEPNNKRTLRS